MAYRSDNDKVNGAVTELTVIKDQYEDGLVTIEEALAKSLDIISNARTELLSVTPSYMEHSRRISKLYKLYRCLDLISKLEDNKVTNYLLSAFIIQPEAAGVISPTSDITGE